MKKIFLCLTVIIIIVGSIITLKQPLKNFTKDIINQHIIENPHVIAQSMNNYLEHLKLKEQEESERKLLTHHDQIFKVTPLTPVIGNPDACQAIVVFMEPFCPHCRNFEKTLDTLITQNKKLKIILRYIPIFGAKSEFVIKLFLSASRQGQAAPARKLIQTIDHKLTDREILLKFKSLGLDMVQLQKDLDSPSIIQSIEYNLKLMDLLNIQPVPTYIINNKMYSGAHSLPDILKQLTDAYHP